MCDQWTNTKGYNWFLKIKQSNNKTEGAIVDPLTKFRLDDRVAIITGGGRGIGKTMAEYFAMVGAHIVIAEIDQKTCEEAVKDIRALGRKSLPVVVDVTNSKQIAKMVEATKKEFGRIDILVNNAGVFKPITPVTQITDEDWDWILRVNLTGTFLCSRAVSRVMIDQKKGNIINIASAAGTRANPGLAHYSASKAGIINFTQTLSTELARYHIRVNCIIPAAIESVLGAAMRGSAEERVKRAGIPLGRVGYPEDVALAAIYLASDASDYVTGTSIDVRGGPLTRKGDMEMFIEKFPEL